MRLPRSEGLILLHGPVSKRLGGLDGAIYILAIALGYAGQYISSCRIVRRNVLPEAASTHFPLISILRSFLIKLVTLSPVQH